ncbi:S-adenosylmethionine:tRNA ribosyltransferase-isomerase, partial [Candidatus Saccharibacteria bacterium]|nr:S-adenosylmethionine:tRNA ribosyltransferase-isomerase [Candidatus Saccharibacteria bacterium]
MLYNFDLPDRLIAQVPASPRDSAKLLVYSMASRQITDAVFSDIDRFLAQDTTLVVNNSKVENCRWIFGAIEVFVLEKNDPTTIRALVRPGKKFRVGKKLQINDWLSFETLAIDEDGIRTLRISVPHDD